MITLDSTEPDLSWYRQRCEYYSDQQDRDRHTIQVLRETLDAQSDKLAMAESSIRQLCVTREELQQAIKDMPDSRPLVKAAKEMLIGCARALDLRDLIGYANRLNDAIKQIETPAIHIRAKESA